MLDINMSDVISLIQQNQNYLIALGVILAIGLIAMVACFKLKKTTKYLILTQSVVAMVIAIATTVICVLLGYPIAYAIAKGNEKSGFSFLRY